MSQNSSKNDHHAGRETTDDIEQLLASSRTLLENAIELHHAQSNDAPGFSRRRIDQNWGAEIVNYLRQARTEVILAISNPLNYPRRTTSVYESGWDALRQLSRKGKPVHVMYSSAYLEACSRTHIVSRAADGPSVRVVPIDFQNLLIVDRQLLVIWGGAGSEMPSVSVIQLPALLDSMRVFAKMSWGSGTELGAYLASESGFTELSIGVLSMLEKGVKDEVAARLLGVSIRTYRRHVAHLLDQVSASTRFQAGSRYAELGLISTTRAL